MASYLRQQHRTRARFRVYPAHSENEFLPITYIEPLTPNRAALGLDIAHENNRCMAAKKAHDTSLAQVTGPITLVQDSAKIPVFLFYAPFYRSGSIATQEQRKQRFAGMVYAPFVARKLMQGVLDKDKRHVGIRIWDKSEMLYDEHRVGEPGFDPEPLYTRELRVEPYGRTWRFEIWSDKSFRAAATDKQSATILIGGIIIDSLLVVLFMSLSRSNRRALAYADHATEQLRQRTTRLERSNADLAEFAYIASRDLQEPLRMIGNFSKLLQRHYSEQRDEKADKYFDFVLSGAQRMGALLNDLLEYLRIDSERKPAEAMDFASVCDAAIHDLGTAIEESSAVIGIGTMPQILGDRGQLTRPMQNLLSTALKFRAQERSLHIAISVTERAGEWCFAVADNGIGIEMRYFDKSFVMFRRLHGRDKFDGTGVGLAVCKKIAANHGGAI
jgi:signal transduction histidine kinase